MIRKSIEPGTLVWNEDYGFGRFKKWSEFDKDSAIVKCSESILQISRKHLIEIEDEPKEKQEQEFNPPV